ncbi:UDP-N-acetylmuramate dehydrogenase [Metabacillus fastidiosus]|uniref:UDP-N-acetylmuramate dehydrogenase n=1 Tax=Metabacillus fastidiosus TaxID=1458 RepID=UPI003D27A291
MKSLLTKLVEAEVGKVIENEPLAHHTTIKIGGPAEIFVEPKNIESLKRTLTIVREHDASFRVIGRGSNLLVSDEGMKGVVIKLGQGLDDLEMDGDVITVGAGYSLVKLATVLSRQGFSGLEFAAGIPGSVGGAVYMNAGAHRSDMSNILVKAHILFEDGTTEWLTNEQMEYSYRTSILQKKRPGICLEAVLKLSQAKKEDVLAVLKQNKDYRRDTQPWNYPCAGSIFRNPLPNYAGQLVEEAGLKGYQIGGAKVSDMHGNFIVNAGGAKAKDVLDLIEYIKKEILEKYDITIETEVEIIGSN